MLLPNFTLLTETASDRPAPALPKGYVCCRADNPLTIDGRLDKPAWQPAPWTDDFVDIEGDLRPKPRFRTRAKMLWDDTYLYIGAEMDEPHVWGTLTEHDSVIFQDNDFEVFIDPDGDNHEYYEIEINALNTVWDLRLTRPYRDKGSAINEWEIPGLKTAVWIGGTLNDPRDTDGGWSVEMAFPWTALAEYANCPAPPRDGDHWRINFSRVEWEIEIVEGAYRKIAGKPEDNWVWSPQGVVDMHRPETWGYIQFSTAPSGAVAFRPDRTAPARDALHQVYYAQRDFHKQHGRWAATLSELALPTEPNPTFAAPLEMRPTPDGYQASVLLRLPDNQTQRWYIRQDSRVWTE